MSNNSPNTCFKKINDKGKNKLQHAFNQNPTFIEILRVTHDLLLSTLSDFSRLTWLSKKHGPQNCQSKSVTSRVKRKCIVNSTCVSQIQMEMMKREFGINLNRAIRSVRVDNKVSAKIDPTDRIVGGRIGRKTNPDQSMHTPTEQ